MRLKFWTLVLGAGVATLATPASASYTAKCDKLIAAWEQCKATGRACKAENQKIVEECKCHRQQQGTWKLIIAAVGKDGVCAPRPPKDPPPPPPEKPKKPKPVTTHGGVRAPGEKPPGKKDENPGEQRQDDGGGLTL